MIFFDFYGLCSVEFWEQICEFSVKKLGFKRIYSEKSYVNLNPSKHFYPIEELLKDLGFNFKFSIPSINDENLVRPLFKRKGFLKYFKKPHCVSLTSKTQKLKKLKRNYSIIIGESSLVRYKLYSINYKELFMKLIHLTDLHYGNKKEAIYSREPSAMMRLAIEDINKNHSDADFAFITGDLTHKGSLQSYKYLKEDLDTLKIPYYLILGNHDNKNNALKIFKNLKQDENGFIQYVLQCDQNNVFIALDTVKFQSNCGQYCKKRRTWLKNILERYREKNIFIWLHHAPFKTGIKAMDLVGLNKRDSLELYDILKQYKNIKHLFLGHYHNNFCGKYKDISFSCLKAMSHQVSFDLRSKKICLEFRNPEYGVVLLDNETLIIHYRDFLVNEKITQS